MAEKKISKTARASMANREITRYFKPCPQCGQGMVATKFVKSSERAGGMYWVCDQDDFAQRT
ncbi:MAG: hypothetical protein LAO31_13335 [Acidobacteriia bacterium]|nr:hypothetical protein [Terriglobia bacterium]